MQLPQYTLTLTLQEIQTVADHLKAGSYNAVVGVLNNIASQVAKQEHEADQKVLQEQVAAAADGLPATGPVPEIIKPGEAIEQSAA